VLNPEIHKPDEEQLTRLTRKFASLESSLRDRMLPDRQDLGSRVTSF
jgi:hypothetical protein